MFIYKVFGFFPRIFFSRLFCTCQNTHCHYCLLSDWLFLYQQTNNLLHCIFLYLFCPWLLHCPVVGKGVVCNKRNTGHVFLFYGTCLLATSAHHMLFISLRAQLHFSRPSPLQCAETWHVSMLHFTNQKSQHHRNSQQWFCWCGWM